MRKQKLSCLHRITLRNAIGKQTNKERELKYTWPVS